MDEDEEKRYFVDWTSEGGNPVKQPPFVRYIWEAYGAEVNPPPGTLETPWVRDREAGRELAFLDMAIRQFDSWLPARRRRVLDYLNARYPREEL